MKKFYSEKFGINSLTTKDKFFTKESCLILQSACKQASFTIAFWFLFYGGYFTGINTVIFMINAYYGELAALSTAVFWTITALAFEGATKRVGTYSVNVIRLFFAFILLAVFSYYRRGLFFPADAGQHAWIWLSVSGLVGFVLGDLFLFASYPIIGSRTAMLIMTLVPPMSALISWFLLGETMDLISLGGMFLVVGGIATAIGSRNKENNKIKLNFPAKGLFFAFLGAVGQAGGLVLSKFGMKSYDPFAATQIRIIAGFLAFVLLISFLRRWRFIPQTLKNKKAMTGIGVGSFFGPFLGVSFSLIAVQRTHTGIASTLMSIVPILIILPAVLIFKQKVTIKEIIGACISVLGVALFFI